ncbi:MAG: serine/threonine protein kinase [Gemmatimonadaceae bacterium]|nr:serine/threonine protein kinase [Gemmatimonadaceae bacterium]
MSLLTDAYAQGHHDALTKYAAAGIRAIRRLVAQGTPEAMAGANRLAKTPGVLPANNALGSHVRDLGRGSEGLATLVAHPQHGVAVRKMYDPNASAYSPEIIRRKEGLGSLPGVAKFLGSTKTMHNTPVHFSEYVPGVNASHGLRPPGSPTQGLTPAQQQSYISNSLAARRAAKEHGLVLRDMRPGNAVATPDGSVKFIDHAPFRPHEIERADPRLWGIAVPGWLQARHALSPTPAGERLFPGAPSHGFSPEVSSANPAQFRRYMTTGDVVPPPPPKKNVGPTGTEIMAQTETAHAPLSSVPTDGATPIIRPQAAV